MRTASRSRFAVVGTAMAALLIVVGLPFAQPVAAANFNVTVASNTYTPQNLGNITAGDTVTWVWAAGTHDVTSATIPATATAWQSPLLTSTNTTFVRTFTVAGNYRYFCSLHSNATEANLTTQSTAQQVGQFTVVADTTPPAAPTALTATGFSGSQINLTWTPSIATDVASQQIFRNTVNTKPGTAIAIIANNTTASYADTGLTAATLYYYWLDAVDGAGNRSTTSATASATTVSVNATALAQQIVLFDIAATLSLSVTPASINFGPVSPAAAMPTAVGATVANVKSNGGWSLNVKSIGADGIDQAPGDDLVFTSGLNTVPVSRMGWRVNPNASTAGSATYTPLSDVNATVGTAIAATPAAGVDTYLQYQLQTQYSDPPALAYRTVLLFTATSP